MSPEQSKTQWSCNAHTPPPRPPKSVPKHQYIQLALDSACPRVHTWCAEYRICTPHLHLITSHGSVPSLDQWGQSSSPCGLHCLGTDLTGHREWRSDRHTSRKAGIPRQCTVMETHQQQKPGTRALGLLARPCSHQGRVCSGLHPFPHTKSKFLKLYGIDSQVKFIIHCLIYAVARESVQ